MVQFTVEETNLMSIYQEGGKAQLKADKAKTAPKKAAAKTKNHDMEV